MTPETTKRNPGSARDVPLCHGGKLPRSTPWRLRALMGVASGQMVWAWLLLAIGLVGLCVLDCWMRRMVVPAGFISLNSVLAYWPVALVLFMSGAGLWLGRPTTRRLAIAACLKAGFCPACAYPIAGVAMSPDGALRCPECGNSWKVDM
jgi:hypothetical protein